MSPSKNTTLMSSDEIHVQPVKLLTPLEILRFMSEIPPALCAVLESDTLNALELNAVENIIAYIAFAEKTDKLTVTSILTSTFGVKEVKDILSKQYEQVIRFLLELNTKLIIN